MRILVSFAVFSLFFLCSGCQNQPASGTDAAATSENPAANPAGTAADPAVAADPAAAASVENLPLVREDRIIKQMEADNFAKVLAAKPNIVLLDLRSPAEYELGHIARAVNMPAGDPGFPDKLNGLGLGNEYAVYCYTGSTSMNVAQQMKAAGFSRVYHLHGGLGSWTNAKFPVQKSK